MKSKLVVAVTMLIGIVVAGCGSPTAATTHHHANRTKIATTSSEETKGSTSPSDQSSPLYSVDMITPNTGWAFVLKPRDELALVHTTDGGFTWTKVMPSSQGTPLFYALDGQTAWLAMVQGAGQPTTVYVTHNGGRAWDHGPAVATHVGAGGFSTLYFENAKDGWWEEGSPGNPPQGPGQGPGTPASLFATTDGGLTWHLVTSTLPSAGDFAFSSATTGFLASFDSVHPLYVTNDGGATWNPVRSFPTGVQIITAPVLNGANALTWAPQTPLGGQSSATQTSLELIASTDGGSTWTTRSTSFMVPSVGDVEILNALTAVAVTRDGEVHVTVDGGKTWSSRGPSPILASVLLRYSPQQIDFVSLSVGWMRLQVGPSLTGVWYSTKDGGATWTPENTLHFTGTGL